MEKKKYPIGPENYTLYEEIGQGVSASVYRALCIPIDEIVAIKILDFERGNCDLNSVSREAQIMNLVDHANVLRSHCSFVCDHNLWVVMPYMAGGSCLHILKAAYPHGFEEVVIATILREVLKGLEYLHDHGHIHRDVKAGNILIDSKGAIKLGDFGVSACLFDSGDRQRVRNTFVGTPCWMAPEVMAQLHGYDFKADIWSFGITALELAHGHAPFSKYPPMKVLLMTLQNAPPGLDYERDKKFSKSFKQMIAICLVKDPSKRPTAKKLLKHSFFKQARSNDHLSRKLLEGLPALGDRIKALKQKEEDMLAQEKMPDGEKEELSQNKYKRGISGWNFNLEDVKAQAALMPDDDVIYDKDQGGGSSSQISDNEENELVTYRPSTLPLEVSNGNLFKSRGEKWDDEASVSTSSNQEHPPSESSSPPLGDQQHGECINVPLESPDKECSAKKSVISNSSASALPLHRRRVSSAACTYMVEIPPPSRVESFKSSMQTLQSSDGGTSCHAGDDTLLETPPKSSKDSSDLITGNNEEVEEKKKIQVVQQKGRFKVTSENLDMEKVGPTPLLQKSHSMQVISQQGTTMVSSSPYEAPSSHVVADSFFPMLQTFLQTNITQRESILNMMKQVASGDFPGNRIGNGGGTYANIAEIERSLLEAAHDREKELLHDVTELQWRLICAQEAIQKLKTESSGTNP